MILRHEPRQATNFCARPRLARSFASASARRVTVIAAAPGCGKTTELDAHMRGVPGATALHRVRFEDASLPLFVRSLVDAIDEGLGGLSTLYGAAFMRLHRHVDPWTMIAGWLCERLSAPMTIAIDQFERTDADPAIAAFVTHLIDGSPEHIRWLIATRSAHALPIARWLAEDAMNVPLESVDFALDYTELRGLAAALQITAAELLRLETKHDGNVGAIVADAFDLDATYRRFEHRCDELVALAALPSIAPSLSLAMTPAMSSTLRDLDGVPFAIRIHDRDLVLDERAREWAWRFAGSPVRARNGQRLAGAVLEACGKHADALAMYVAASAQDDILRLLDEQGDALAENGASDMVSAAIEILDPQAANRSPIALSFKATDESHRGRYDTAEAWFEQALALPQSDSQRLYVRMAFATDLLRRCRPDAVEKFEALRGATASSARTATIVASLATAYASAERLAEARACLGEVLARVDSVFEPLVRARIHQRIAFVALCCSDASFAAEQAEHAATLAERFGDEELLAVARTTSYVVAVSFRDDQAGALRALAEIETAGLSARSRFFERFAIIGAYCIHTERGDRAFIRKLDGRLMGEELEASIQQVEEGVLPSRAMQLAWSGDFAGAYNLVVPTLKHHLPADSRALHASEVAFYAAAAGLETEAHAAFAEMYRALRQSDDDNVEFAKAYMLSSITALMLGRPVATRTLLRRGAERLERWPRWRALHAVAQGLADMYDGADDVDMLAAFAKLDESDLGGYTRMLAALPTHRLPGKRSTA